MFCRIMGDIKMWLRHRRFREGRTLSRFIARDIRRDHLIVSTERIEERFITCQTRTTNVLYVSKHLVPASDFEQPREIRIEDLWNWTGQNWGGLPDGTSIVKRSIE